MKKKLFCLVLVLCLCAALAGCGSGASSASTAGTDGFAFQVSSANGYAVRLNTDMADVLAALGEPLSYFEAASCAFDGLDKTYTYAGFSITTRPDGEQDFVNSVLLTDDSVTTPEGVYIGSSAADVTAAYGESGGTEAVLSYTKGDTAINFVMENGVVASIEYLPAY